LTQTQTDIPPTLAVVIVTWNVRHVIADALRSVIDDLTHSGLNAHIVVIDSASNDGTPELVRTQFPTITLVESIDNLGFARANNAALRQLGFWSGRPAHTLPRAVFLLNPDTVTSPGAVRTLLDHLFSSDRIGVVGPSLTYGDGSFQHAAFAFPGLRQLWAEFFPTPGRLIEGRFNGRYRRSLYQSGQPFEVDFVLGAAMLVRAEVIEQTGGFDESFFMYCEEIDWQWRIRSAGWQIRCIPTAHIVHLGGQSTGQIRTQSQIDLWRSRMRLYERIYPPWKQRAARWLMRAGMRRAARRVSADVAAAYRIVLEQSQA